MNHRITTFLVASCLGGLVTLGAPTTAVGQEQGGSSSSALEEITVTAQRREQSLQDVPLSITAFSGDDLTAMGVNQALDITSQVPNLNVYTIFGDGQQPSLNIRGIGLLSFTDSFEPPVAMYSDDVYKGAGVGQSIQMFDIERVEVLRGPQGTLFGRNATGGLLHLISRRPTEEFQGDVSAQFGSFNQVVLKGAIGGSISDNVRGRLAVKSNQQDGFADGFFDGEEYADADSIGIRGTLDIDLGDDGGLLLIATHSDSSSNTGAVGITGAADPITGELCSLPEIKTGNCVSLDGIAFSGVPFSGNDIGGFNPDNVPGASPAGFGVDPRQSVEVSGLTSQLDWGFDAWDMKAIVAYEETEKYYFEDLVIFSDGFTLDANQLSAEFRASGDVNGVNWVGGLYFFDDEKDMGSFDPTPGFGFSTRGIQDTESWALYGQTTIPLSDALSLTVGGRYTEESKDLAYTTDFGIDEQRSLDTDAITGKIGLDWKVNEETLLYFGASSGFKSGGFNGQFVFSADTLTAVEDETLLTYEAGLKTDFLDGRARLNSSIFFNDYQDVQLNSLAATPSGGVATVLTNAGDAEIFGFEAELTVFPTDNFELDLGLALLDTEMKTDALLPSGDPLRGKELPGAPAVTYNLLANYEIPTDRHGSFVLQAAYSWLDDHFFLIENEVPDAEEAYGLLNLSVGWRSQDERTNVSIFVDNVTDEEYLIFGGDLTDTTVVSTWGKPRIVGVRFAYEY